METEWSLLDGGVVPVLLNFTYVTSSKIAFTLKALHSQAEVQEGSIESPQTGLRDISETESKKRIFALFGAECVGDRSSKHTHTRHFLQENGTLEQQINMIL